MSDYKKTSFSLFLALAFLLAVSSLHAGEQGAAEHAEHDHAADSSSESSEPVETKLKIGKTDTLIQVGDLHCKTCAKKISRKLYAVKSVVKVRTDVAADVAIVTPQKNKKLDTQALWSAAQKAGFQPVRLEGPAGKYEPDPKTKAPVLVPAEVASNSE